MSILQLGEQCKHPESLIRLKVALIVERPQQCAGILKDPPLSVPIPKWHPPAPTSAAVPLLDPPGPNLLFNGFKVCPNIGLSEPIDRHDCGRLVRQKAMAPRFSIIWTNTADSLAGLKSSLESPQDESIPITAVSSFTQNGIPCRGPLMFSNLSNSLAFSWIGVGRMHMCIQRNIHIYIHT